MTCFCRLVKARTQQLEENRTDSTVTIHLVARYRRSKSGWTGEWLREAFGAIVAVTHTVAFVAVSQQQSLVLPISLPATKPELLCVKKPLHASSLRPCATKDLYHSRMPTGNSLCFESLG